MSRILVDLPEAQVQALAALVQAEGRPRAALIRDAIDTYLAQRRPAPGKSVFGLWKGRQPDGLEYQEAMRSEW
ncbi:MAG: ribbon-helix-helix protein, CopG family [Acidovorax sp.]